MKRAALLIGILLWIATPAADASRLDCADIELIEVKSSGNPSFKQARFKMTCHCAEGGYNVDVELRTSKDVMPPQWRFQSATQMGYFGPKQNKPSIVQIEYKSSEEKMLRVTVKHAKNIWGEQIFPLD